MEQGAKKASPGRGRAVAAHHTEFLPPQTILPGVKSTAAGMPRPALPTAN